MVWLISNNPPSSTFSHLSDDFIQRDFQKKQTMKVKEQREMFEQQSELLMMYLWSRAREGTNQKSLGWLEGAGVRVRRRSLENQHVPVYKPTPGISMATAVRTLQRPRFPENRSVGLLFWEAAWTSGSWSHGDLFSSLWPEWGCSGLDVGPSEIISLPDPVQAFRERPSHISKGWNLFKNWPLSKIHIMLTFPPPRDPHSSVLELQLSFI